MKPHDLLLDLARIPHYHELGASVDGWNAQLLGVSPDGHGAAVVEVLLDDDLAVSPLDATDAMLDAAATKCFMPRELARNVWAAMIQAYLDENE